MPPPISQTDHPQAQIARLIREDWGRILAALNASFKNYTLAEDSLQDAAITALEVWPSKGVPDNPAGWMLAVARRKALDRLRRLKTMTDKEEELSHWLESHHEMHPDDAPETDGAIPDKRLELIFTCCHPALDEKSRVALTLRALGGLTTEEIAKAFLDKTETMAARLTRAKKKLGAAGIAFKLPEPADIAERTDAVLRVVYLIFNEGNYATNGTLSRVDLVTEAIRLGRILCALLPDEAEAQGLLALMLLGESRRFARMDDGGAYIPLEAQNRARWDQAKINEGLRLVELALSRAPAGPYAIQAAISALHAQAPSFAQTDWAQIVLLYDLLQARTPNPILAVNQAVAISYADDPAAALTRLDQVAEAPKLQNYQPYYTCRADLLARLGQSDAAKAAYARAIALSPSAAQAAFLKARLDAL